MGKGRRGACPAAEREQDMEQTEGSVWVIIPVYNAAATLPRCLDSLLRQTYPWWTACLIDDGSADNSLQICQKYARLDKRFKCLCNHGHFGPAAARNRGLGRARGTYVAFLDSSDWWDDTFLEQMVGMARLFQADFVQCGWALEWPDGKRRLKENTYPDFRVFDRENFSSPLTGMLRDISVNHMSRKLVRRSLLEGLTFSAQLPAAEELAMCFQLLMRARRIAFVPDPLYHQGRPGLTRRAPRFGPNWAARRTVARMMQAAIRGTDFDTVQLRFLVWAYPCRLLASQALRFLQAPFRPRKDGVQK